MTGAAARMIHIHPRLAVGDAFPSSLRPAINSSRFGIGIFLDPRLRGQPIEKTLEDAMKQAETAGAGDMEKQIRNLIQQAVLLDGADSFAEKLVALTMAGVQASRRRVMLELQEKNGIPSSVSCPNCKDKCRASMLKLSKGGTHARP